MGDDFPDDCGEWNVSVEVVVVVLEFVVDTTPAEAAAAAAAAAARPKYGKLANSDVQNGGEVVDAGADSAGRTFEIDR